MLGKPFSPLQILPQRRNLLGSEPQEASLCNCSPASRLLITFGPWDKLADDQWTGGMRSHNINFLFLPRVSSAPCVAALNIQNCTWKFLSPSHCLRCSGSIPFPLPLQLRGSQCVWSQGKSWNCAQVSIKSVAVNISSLKAYKEWIPFLWVQGLGYLCLNFSFNLNLSVWTCQSPFVFKGGGGVHR